jgi:hypothetical protein
MRSDRARGRAEAVLVAYDVMEADGRDMRPEPLETRRKRLARLLSRKAIRDGIQLSEAIAGDWRRDLSARMRYGPGRNRLEADRLTLRERPHASLAEDEQPAFQTLVNEDSCVCRRVRIVPLAVAEGKLGEQRKQLKQGVSR